MRLSDLRASAIALACTTLLASPAWAANSGGSTGTACGVTSYVGVCATGDSPATSGNVMMDTDPGGPTYGGFHMMPTGIARGNRVTVDGSGTVNDRITGGYGVARGAFGKLCTIGGPGTNTTTTRGGE